MTNIKEGRYKPRLHVFVNLFCPLLAAILGNFAAVDVVVRTRPRAIPLAMTTMRKSIHGFPFLPYMGMGLRSRAFGAQDLRY